MNHSDQQDQLRSHATPHTLSMEKGRVGVPGGQGKDATMIVAMVEIIAASLTKQVLAVLTELSRRHTEMKRKPDLPNEKRMESPRSPEDAGD